jgi:lysophospholipase L1-like esterase
MKTLTISILILFVIVVLFRFIDLQKTHTSALKDFIQITHQHYIRKARTIDHDSVVFLGSSSVQGLNVGQITRHGVNMGIGGERMRGLIQRVPDYPKLDIASVLVFGVGFNDLCRGTSAENIADYDELLWVTRRENIIISNMQPTTSLNRCEDIKNRMSIFNEYLREKCRTLKNCYYVDLFGLLQGSKREVFEQDGVHLNELGYELWQKELMKAINFVLSENEKGLLSK